MLKDRKTKYTHGDDGRMRTTHVPRGANITYSRTMHFDTPPTCTLELCENHRQCQDSNSRRLEKGKSILRTEQV